MKLLKFILFFCLISFVQAQPDLKYSAVDIQNAVNKLNVLGSVLYVAAHPDDENQAILTYMAKGRHYQAAYLSLTRGGGGQNLLGPEKGVLLGILRTQELLQARRIDGARQYFSRAIDFGYSKTPQESLTKWDHDLLLADVVKVIRQTRPDVIITRFSEKYGGHGHHISSAILAKEAFSAAADPTRFPGQLKELQPWQSKRIVWNTWRPEDATDKTPATMLDLGEYNPLLGLSYREIAAKSRTMHKTQGFGATPRRGKAPEFFLHTAGSIAQKDLFEDIDTSWKRVKGSEGIQKKVTELIDTFIPQEPQKSIPGLISLYKLLAAGPQTFWTEIKKKEVQRLLQLCSGLWIESIALQEAVSPGDSLEVQTSLLNRSDFDLVLEKNRLSYSTDSVFNAALKNGQIHLINQNIQIPIETPYSQPYWLQQAPSETMFNVNSSFRGLPEEQPEIITSVTVRFDDLALNFDVPVAFKWNDPVSGEQYKPVYIEPAVSISMDEGAYIFPDASAKVISVSVVANKDSVAGDIIIRVPPGWHKEPETQSFSLEKINQQQTVTFTLTPLEQAGNGEVNATAVFKDKDYDQQLLKIAYSHIPQQNVLLDATAKLIKLDIVVPDKNIAYIMGSGDEIPQALQEIGMAVDLLDDNDLKSVDYAEYDAVICGVRAFNTREELALYQNRILDYVAQGGVWIVQHNTRFGLQVSQKGPYPYVARGRSRVSEEDAAVQILEPQHPLLNYPNKIAGHDFDNWVQERGTYMAENWDDAFIPLLAAHDKGEEPQKGGLLYSNYAKGVFIFTGFSWFRQLPAGVPGAYRIFVNMICAADKNI